MATMMNEDIVLKPDNLPEDSTFIDHSDYVVQDIIISSWNVRYRRGGLGIGDSRATSRRRINKEQR